MADDLDSDSIPAAERARIRAEVRYALIAAREARPPEAKGVFSRLLDALSNGFVLLVVGSIISALLVPALQRASEQRAKRTAQMQECLSQFLLYTNSLWEEYYAVMPLTQEAEIDKATYLAYLDKVAGIKLKRYEAYEKIQALAVLVPASGGEGAAASLSEDFRSYQVQLNEASASIDAWLTGLYCTPLKRDASPCATFDPSFDAYGEHLKIKQRVVTVGNTSKERLAQEIARRISDY
ncbi:hypothetical protein [Pelomonas sp. KK5]|uniref:hypothetical protein n=1 Tax=Pelomonas sp. KK5 TaxID=1855730 RepID=UPI001301EAD1|nr:hypothetical protein [Pelomonas sp. KK5]